MLSRTSAPSAARVALVASALAGALGLLPGAAGALDPITELAWLALLAPAAGAACGSAGVAFGPAAGAVPALWCVFVVWADARSERDLATPLWAGFALAGLFFLGLALGACRPARACLLAGCLLLAGLGATGLALEGELAPGSLELARRAPRLARAALAASPLGFVHDCAGWDWTHANPDVYARSGVEWVPRRPWPGSLAGPGVLVVGCALAWLACRRRSADRAEGEAPSP